MLIKYLIFKKFVDFQHWNFYKKRPSSFTR